MSPLLAITKSEGWTRAVRKTKRFFRWIIALLVILSGVFIGMKYFYTYSEGYRAGLLQKFSNKGVIVKTYEGELILSSVASNNEVAIASEKFLFTMVNKDLIRQFDTLQGQNVIVHYIQKGGFVFSGGETQNILSTVLKSDDRNRINAKLFTSPF